MDGWLSVTGGRSEWKMESPTNKDRISCNFWNYIVVMVAQLCESIKILNGKHFLKVQF